VSAVAAAESYRRQHQVSDQQMSHSLSQPLQLDIWRKTAKTVPLKHSNYLDKNAFYSAMLSDRRPVCHVLSVINVGVLWPNGWTDQNETWHAGKPRP